MVATFPALYAPVDMARRKQPYNRSEPISGTLGAYVRFRRAIESPDVLRYLLNNLDADRVAFGADREAFLAYLPRFLESEGPGR